MDRQRTEQTIPQVPKGLLVFGSVLILIGALIALIVAGEVLRVYQQVGNNFFIGGLVERFKEADIFIYGSDPLVVTEQGAFIIAFMLFILLALISVHIAIAFIRAGAHIVSPAFTYQFAQLKRRIDDLREKLSGK